MEGSLCNLAVTDLGLESASLSARMDLYFPRVTDPRKQKVVQPGPFKAGDREQRLVMPNSFDRAIGQSPTLLADLYSRPPWCSHLCWWLVRSENDGILACLCVQAHITHPELKCTFNLEIIGVKKNPNGPMYTQMGVLTKGTIIEVRCRRQ